MANSTPKPKFQIEDATYTYCHITDTWSFTLPFNKHLYRRFTIYDACIPNNDVWYLRNIALHLGFASRNKKLDYLLRRIRKCKGRKQ